MRQGSWSRAGRASSKQGNKSELRENFRAKVGARTKRLCSFIALDSHVTLEKRIRLSSVMHFKVPHSQVNFAMISVNSYSDDVRFGLLTVE